MQHFPLQNKKLQRLTLPYAKVGICEMMNASSRYFMDSFNVYNTKNKKAYTLNHPICRNDGYLSEQASSIMGEMIGGGLMDSYTGATAPRFVAHYLAKALSMHTIVPSELAALRKERPGDLLVDLMLTSMHRHRTFQHNAISSSGAALSSEASRAVSTDAARRLRSVMTDWDSQQYAICADAAFFRCCHLLQKIESLRENAGGIEHLGNLEDNLDQLLTQVSRNEAELVRFLVNDMKECDDGRTPRLAEVLESGCSGVWFTATVAPFELETQRECQKEKKISESRMAPPPEKYAPISNNGLPRHASEKSGLPNRMGEQKPYCLDLMVSNVGNSRAFGILRSRLSKTSRSFLDSSREHIVPLSIDHRPFQTEERRRITSAGGKVSTKDGCVIDDNPFFTVSRSFGHWSMKNNPNRSPVRQKIIPLPSSASWEMLPGDILVLSNHALYETRHEEDTDMDELAKLAGRAVDRGLPPEEVAATLCDFALRFGAEHSVQVMVMVATNLARGPEERLDEAAKGPFLPLFHEYIRPGPFYAEACRRIPEYCQALRRDCRRCGIKLPELLKLRWERVKDILHQRHALPLHIYYGKECGGLQQIMDEEADLFADLIKNESSLYEDDIFLRLEKDLMAEDKMVQAKNSMNP
ncbi:unnamed protein product [Phytomonas sp. Hart1]|nr:unnamed protein product [Phytomonas sp. Hart1]|eukprot:CCW67032.1 unnamed protein product [Phytomonas sp. isolate Hart1]